MASDKDIENWLNDHQGTIPTPQPEAKVPADAEIEAWLNDQGPSSQGNIVMDAAKQIGATMTGDTAQFAQPISSIETNPVKAALMKLAQPFQGAIGPSRLSASISQPGQIAGQGVTSSLNDLSQNLNNGQPPSKLIKGVNSVIGAADAMSLDPQNYVGEGLTKGLVALGEKGAAKLGEEAAAGASAVSGVKFKDIINLFKNPMDVLTAPSLSASGAKMGAVEKFLGVTEDEARLIAKAADRASGASRTVVEDLIQKGKDLAVEAGAKAEDWANYLTPGELIAGRRGASKLTSVAKGRDLYQSAQDLKTFETAFVAKAQDQAVQYLGALKDQVNARTRDAFMRLIPRGKTGAPDFFRTIAAAGTGLTTSPAAVGLGTLAASAANQIAAPVARIATSPATGNTGLAVLKRYLLQQTRPH